MRVDPIIIQNNANCSISVISSEIIMEMVNYKMSWSTWLTKLNITKLISYHMIIIIDYH